MVNLNESKSMINDSKKDHRITIAIQYLTSFVNRIYGYNLPCIQGLVSFNNQIKVKCPLSPLVSDFEDKGLKNIKPEATTKLWDSLLCCCEEIVKFRKDSKGNELYKNAISRIIVISGGGGYYITGYIGELSLDQIKVGQKVSVMSYNSGSMAEGVVKEVSNIPLSNYRNFGMGNSNVSYYPFTVFVSEEAQFREGDYVQLTPQVDTNVEAGSSSLYLMKAFILEENGKYYVYVANQDNKLEKRQIFINGGAYENLKIQSGITESDRVAFPYGKNVKEGVTAVDGSLEDLYNY